MAVLKPVVEKRIGKWRLGRERFPLLFQGGEQIWNFVYMGFLSQTPLLNGWICPHGRFTGFLFLIITYTH